jgi:hypothetical protein
VGKDKPNNPVDHNQGAKLKWVALLHTIVCWKLRAKVWQCYILYVYHLQLEHSNVW